MRMIDEIEEHAARGAILLTEWEERFIEDMKDLSAGDHRLTDAQFNKVLEIYNNHIGER